MIIVKKFTSYGLRMLCIVGIAIFFVVTIARPTNGQHTGPVHVQRDLTNPSIQEGTVEMTAGYKKGVDPTLGQLSANYSWFGGFMSALGSMYKVVDPTWLSIKTGQKIGMSFYSVKVSNNINASRTYEGIKKLGKDVTDTASLGQVCGKKPGDAYWVAYWRPGNVENPPAFQTWHNQYDCYCRCGEQIACPIPDYAGYNNWNTIGGCPATHYISCEMCFGYGAHIRKHDYYVGTDHGTHAGYPVDDPEDKGYQECLRQSVESYGASMQGGTPADSTLFGI